MQIKNYVLDANTNENVALELTEDDVAEREKLQSEAQLFANKLKASQENKQAALEKLAALGLSVDDLKALGLG